MQPCLLKYGALNYFVRYQSTTCCEFGILVAVTVLPDEMLIHCELYNVYHF